MSKFLRSDYDTDSKRQHKRRWVETTDIERDISGVSGPDDETTDQEGTVSQNPEQKKFASDFTQSGEQVIYPNPIIRKREKQSNDDESLERRKRDVPERENMRRDEESLERRRRDDENLERRRRDDEMERRRRDEEIERERKRRDEESLERRRRDDEMERRRREGDNLPPNAIMTTQSDKIPVVNCYCTCKCKERVVYLEGPCGPQGPMGKEGRSIEGPEGPQGKMGPCAKDGRDGENGKRGPKGPPGATGAQGPPGEQGVRGYDGKNGFQGPQGPQGRNGIDGRDAVCPCSKDPLHRGAVVNTRFITSGGRRTLNPDDNNVIIDSASTVTLILPHSPITVDSKDINDYYVQSTAIIVCAVNGIHTITTSSPDSRINSFMNSIVIGNKSGSNSNMLKFYSDGRGSWISC